MNKNITKQNKYSKYVAILIMHHCRTVDVLHNTYSPFSLMTVDWFSFFF